MTRHRTFPTKSGTSSCGGTLILNADDWGRDVETTKKILDCVRSGSVSAVSAMIFMEDSERAAALAREMSIDTGLHLNFTTAFSASRCPAVLHERQEEIARYLLRGRFTQALFHPGLIRSFEYVVRTQLDEFRRLYGEDPRRLDGHHHMHLCANVLWQGLLPAGTIVRRNFSFEREDKSVWNRLYRKFVDSVVARRHHLGDFFFSLAPIQPRERLERIFSLAQHFIVEVETHPVQPDEYTFLMEGGFLDT